MLAADHVGEPVQRALALLAVLTHLALLLLLAAGLQALQHLLELLHQALGLVPGAVSGELLDAVQHVAQVLRPDLAGVRIALCLLLLLAAVLAVAHGLFGQLTHQPVHGLAEILRQPADLFLRGAALDRLAKPLGGLRHRPLGLGGRPRPPCARRCPRDRR